MKKIKQILLLVLLPGFLWATIYDSSTLTNVQNYKGQGLCHLANQKSYTFDSSSTTGSCTEQFGNDYVLVGVSVSDDKKKTIYCMQLVCDYEADTSRHETYYTIPS